MSLVFNSKTYTLDFSAQNVAGYAGAANTASVKDLLRLSRVGPKPTADFSGVARGDAKLTRTLTLTGALTPTWETIFGLNVSVPVGFASADMDAMCNDFGALVSSAAFKLFVKNLQIQH